MEKVRVRKTDFVENILTRQKFRGTRIDGYISSLEKSIIEMDPEGERRWTIMTEWEYKKINKELKSREESFLSLAEGDGGSMKWFFAVGREVSML